MQHESKLAKGIWWFDSAGHGGAIAVIGEADLDERNVAAARQANLIRKINGQEVWVAEEDCDWATLALSSPAMREGMARVWTREGSPRSAEQIHQEAQETSRRWCEPFLAARDPGYTPIPGGMLERERREKAILDSGGVLRRSVIGHSTLAKDVPQGMVKTIFRGRDNVRVEYLMAIETYKAIPTGVPATPDDFRRHGELTPVGSDAPGPLSQPTGGEYAALKQQIAGKQRLLSKAATEPERLALQHETRKLEGQLQSAWERENTA